MSRRRPAPRPGASAALRLLAAGLLLVLTTSPGAPADAAKPGCQGDSWQPVPGSGAAAVTELANGGSCAVFVGQDDQLRRANGAPTAASTFDGPVASVSSTSLPAGDVVVATRRDSSAAAPSLYTSKDLGATFHRASLPTGAAFDRVVAAAGGGSGADRALYLLTSPPGSASGATLLSSRDDGATFTTEPQATPYLAGATALGVDPIDPANLVINTSTAATTGAAAGPQLFRSADSGQSWQALTLPAPGEVADIVYGHTAVFGASQPALYVAGAFGAAVSRDGGADFTPLNTGSRAITSLAPADDARAEAVGITGGRPYLLSAFANPRPAANGLPTSCQAARVEATWGGAGYLLTCADGRAFVHAAGFDRAATDGDGSDGTIGGSVGTAGVLLDVVSLSHTEGGPLEQSAAVVFDGRSLYYLTKGDRNNTNNQILPATTLHVATARVPGGPYAGLLDVPLGPDANEAGEDRGTSIAYSARHNELYVQTHRGTGGSANALRVYAMNLSTKRVRLLMYMPNISSSGGGTAADPAIAYDDSTDDFIAGEEGEVSVAHVSRSGAVRSRCRLPDILAENGVSAIAPVGDGGGFYVQSEDDRTITQYDAQCNAVTTIAHPTLAESGGEDDNLVCDGQTFAVPALWVRDANVGEAFAYAAPSATFCPLPSHLSVVTAASPTRTPTTKRVCADLRIGRWPAAGKPLVWTGAPTAVTITGADGRSCQNVPSNPVRRQVLVQFLGSRQPPQSTPAQADATLLAVTAAVPPIAGPVAGATATVARLVGVPMGTSPANPGPPAQVQPGPQAQSQTQGQSQTQTSNATGVATDEDEQYQLAEVTERSDARRQPGGQQLFMSAAVVIAMSGLALHRLRARRVELQRCAVRSKGGH
jgi:hypothetical protein